MEKISNANSISDTNPASTYFSDANHNSELNSCVTLTLNETQGLVRMLFLTLSLILMLNVTLV